jgi:AcrR family transcriptional regulator
MTSAQESSPRRDELLEAAYRYVLRRGFSTMSLRPLAAEIGTSPRVLLFLFGSKEGLIRELLARARRDELVLVRQWREDHAGDGDRGVDELGAQLWDWMCRPDNMELLKLWVDAYARSLIEPSGPWAEFARDTVTNWLEIFADVSSADPSTATAVLALLRGALLDLLATGDLDRTTAAVRSQLARAS